MEALKETPISNSKIALGTLTVIINYKNYNLKFQTRVIFIQHVNPFIFVIQGVILFPPDSTIIQNEVFFQLIFNSV